MIWTRVVRGRRIGGFSMLEFTNGFSALALLMTAGAGGVNNYVADLERATVSNKLIAGLRVAHRTAHQYGATVTLCPSVDGQTCSGSGDWTDGWIAFFDRDRDGEIGSDERGGIVGHALNDSRAGVSVNAEWDRLSFKPGMPVALAPDDAAATLCILDARGSDHSRVIWIDGRGIAKLHDRRPDRELAENADRDFSQRSKDCY